jgi:acyl-coenzyme A synthetase/AMP-(fatty) acid ligase
MPGLESSIARIQGQTVSRVGFLAEARHIGDRLPHQSHAVNLCQDRYLFALGLVACLLRGIVTLLPPDRGSRQLALIEQAYPDALILTDQPVEPSSHTWLLQRPVAPQMPTRGTALALPGEQMAVIAFTSGSTGSPRPHRKTWGSLCASADHIDRFLGGVRGKTVAATVPSQHMYGLELSILLPLCRGAMLEPSRPFFPVDIVKALAETSEPRILVTTPIHLKALLASELRLPALDCVVSATSPLDPGLAKNCQRRLGVPLFEIYGSTETGSIAGRRPVEDSAWQLFEGIDLRVDNDGVEVKAPHLPEIMPLHDRVRILDDRHFVLEGRSADLINIAGKRASLAALDHTLLEAPGVLDGAFYLPDSSPDDPSTPRLLAFAVLAPSISVADVLQWLRQQLDPAFVPRTLIPVPTLPRRETGKLPREALALLLEAHRPRSRAANDTEQTALAKPARPASTQDTFTSEAVTGHSPRQPKA